MTRQHLWQGALLILLSEAFFVTSGAMIRHVAESGLPEAMIVFARNSFAVLMLLPWLLRQGTQGLATQVWHWHALRALVGVCAMYCFYFSWIHLPLAQAALLKLTAPFFMPIFAWVVLSERVALTTVFAIAVGFVGVAIVLQPQGEALPWQALVALVAAMLSALTRVIIRRLRETEPSTRIVFYFALGSSVISALPLLWFWQLPSGSQLGWLLAIGILSTGAQLSVTRGYGLAPVSQLGVLTYSSVLFAALLGWLLWQEQLSFHEWVGAAVICGAGALAILVKSAKA